MPSWGKLSKLEIGDIEGFVSSIKTFGATNQSNAIKRKLKKRTNRLHHNKTL